MKPEHKRMSRMLGSFVAAVRLTETERAALAFSALNSLKPDDAELTAAVSIGSAGPPLPSFLGGMEEARLWASYASRCELKAYALASFEAMSAENQAAFFRHISEMETAA
ncbi:hypothetical protein SAMN05444413_1139 [Roseivivax marinus]|uniref:hypothetical protein n=1 Tax=Roseivivax marinus TaxID=1379903 RepID=UPI0008BD9456|nr:hypothetical protein [Roseivivax marinus]SEL66549.1 hypothetical protein SAMN05444413_1139 [Roseivivax marinus]